MRARVERNSTTAHLDLETCKPDRARGHVCRQPAHAVCAAHFVRFWHKADMPVVSVDVRFRVQSGQGCLMTFCLLLTQSGHGTGRNSAVRRFPARTEADLIQNDPGLVENSPRPLSDWDRPGASG